MAYFLGYSVVASFASLVAAGPARLAFHEASPGQIFKLVSIYWQVWLVMHKLPINKNKDLLTSKYETYRFISFL